MVKQKRKIAPSPWINYARSCFAADPTSAIPQNSHVHWSDDPDHTVLLRLPHVTVAGGALPPYSATLFHSHHHTSFLLSLLDAPVFLVQDMEPTDYVRRQRHRLEPLTSGACLTQCPVSSSLPLVHRAMTLQHPVAFIVLESSMPPLPTCAPLFAIDEHPSVKLQNRPATNFWAAAELHLEPNARVSFQSLSPTCPLPIGRFICRTQYALDDLEIELPTHLKRDTVETVLADTHLQVISISGFKQSTDTCFHIHNNATDTEWCGVIVDIFGTHP